MLILFTHIPKCSGTSFRRSAIEPNFSRNLLFRPKGVREIFRRRADFAFLVGHFPYGIERFIHALSPARKRKIIRVVALRDPVNLLVSAHRYYSKEVSGCARYEEYSKSSTIDFLKTKKEFVSVQITYLSGFLCWHWRSPIACIMNWLPGFKVLLAKRNILKHYDYVFFTESADQDVQSICNQLDLKYVPVVDQMTKTDREKFMETMSRSELEQIKHISRFDQKMYDWAKANYDRHGVSTENWSWHPEVLDSPTDGASGDASSLS